MERDGNYSSGYRVELLGFGRQNFGAWAVWLRLHRVLGPESRT